MPTRYLLPAPELGVNSQALEKTRQKLQVETVNPTSHTLPHRDPHFECAIEMVKQDAKDILKIYNASPEPVAFELLNEAEELANLPRIDERLVGLVGASGAGKSSLACALLNTKGIAMIGSSGKAVTYFPVYYRNRDPQKEYYTKYNVHCRFYDQSKTEEVLLSFWHDLNSALYNEHDEQVDAIRDRAREAADTFEILFGRQKDFDLKKLSIDSPGVSKESATHSLRQWASNLEWPLGIVDGVLTLAVEDSDQIQQILEWLSDSGLWPLIERMTIFLDADILRDGIILVDLPGCFDASYARAKIARETQARCDHIFLVSPIQRAVDSPILRDVITQNTPRPDIGITTLQTVTAICTHSEEVGSDIEKLVDPHNLRMAKFQLLELQKGDASYKEVTRARNKLKKLKITARNSKVNSDLHEKYDSRLGEGKFQVFCVDSLMYLEPEDEDLDNAEQDTSGIRRLQAYLAKFPGKSSFRVYNSIIGSRHRAMMYSFQTWDSSSRVGPNPLGTILPEPLSLSKLDQGLNIYVTILRNNFSANVIDQILEKTREINENASSVARNWRGPCNSTISALCRKHGTHTSNDGTDYNWNKELISCFNAILVRWADFDAAVEADSNTFPSQIEGALGEYIRICEPLGAPESFLEGLHERQTTLEDAAKMARDAFMQKYGTLKRNINISQDQCYVMAAMCATYDEALEPRGKGALNRRHAILERRVSDPDFIKDVRAQIRQEFNRILQECSSELHRKIGATTQAIKADIVTIQGDRSKWPLFQKYPDLGKKAADQLVRLKRHKEDIEKLADRARQQAAHLYGEEILFT